MQWKGENRGNGTSVEKGERGRRRVTTLQLGWARLRRGDHRRDTAQSIWFDFREDHSNRGWPARGVGPSLSRHTTVLPSTESVLFSRGVLYSALSLNLD